MNNMRLTCLENVTENECHLLKIFSLYKTPQLQQGLMMMIEENEKIIEKTRNEVELN